MMGVFETSESRWGWNGVWKEKDCIMVTRFRHLITDAAIHDYNISFENRLCRFCGLTLETEQHWMLDCSMLEHIRDNDWPHVGMPYSRLVNDWDRQKWVRMISSLLSQIQEWQDGDIQEEEADVVLTGQIIEEGVADSDVEDQENLDGQLEEDGDELLEHLEEMEGLDMGENVPMWNHDIM